MEDKTAVWLLDSEPWIQYITRKELLEQSEDNAEIKDTRKKMLNQSALKSIIDELQNWPGLQEITAGHALFQRNLAHGGDPAKKMIRAPMPPW